jgi:beta-fructofuranosidase
VVAVGAAAVRPVLHFTARSGWVNDPHAVVWHGGRYHLFFQYVPGSARWAPACQWGHATSFDLVEWQEQEPALVPAHGETGCWSGASMVTGEELQLFYTRVAGEHLGRGVVVRARPDGDSMQWRADPAEPVVGPPHDLDVRHFRDPCILRHDGRWVMVVGAGLSDGTAAAFQYTSDDLVGWEYSGVLCQRSTTESDPVWTGAMWECPQFFRLGDLWVLLVSVWADDQLYDVVAATGSYDGLRFTPTRWQTLTQGDSAYATTSFVDRQGRRCLMSWLREAASFDPNGAVRAGAHSVPYVVLPGDDGRLVLQLHPDVEARFGLAVDAAEAIGATAFEVTITGAQAPGVVCLSDGQVETFRVELGTGDRMVVDADIVEVVRGGGTQAGGVVLAARIPRSGAPLRVTLDSGGAPLVRIID